MQSSLVLNRSPTQARSLSSAMTIVKGVLGFSIVVLTLLSLACQTDAQRIREANEAARQSLESTPTPTPPPPSIAEQIREQNRSTAIEMTPTPTQTATPTATSTPKPLPTPEPTATPELSATIDAFDIRTGDCVNIGIDIEFNRTTFFENAELVLCTSLWEYRVVSLFVVDQDGAFPGNSSFDGEVFFSCDRRMTVFIHPSLETWVIGDRTIHCLQESFGLSAEDITFFDSILPAAPKGLSVGECFTDHGLYIRLAPCDVDFDSRVIDQFAISDINIFPGDEGVFTLADAQCDRRSTNFILPVEETWGYGDRDVVCLQESYGLSAIESGKLDRIIIVNELREGECYNEKTEYVELVSCSDNWEFQVVSLFEVTMGGPYPNVDYFDDQAETFCDDRYEFYFYPSLDNWTEGARTVQCIREGTNSPTPASLSTPTPRPSAGELDEILTELFWITAEAAGASRDMSFEEANDITIAVLGRELIKAVDRLKSMGVNSPERWPFCIWSLSALAGLKRAQSAESPVEAAAILDRTIDAIKGVRDDFLIVSGGDYLGEKPPASNRQKCVEFNQEVKESYNSQ